MTAELPPRPETGKAPNVSLTTTDLHHIDGWLGLIRHRGPLRLTDGDKTELDRLIGALRAEIEDRQDDRERR